MKLKLNLISMFMALIFAALSLRIIYLKTTFGAEYEAETKNQMIRGYDELIKPMRGKILDRNSVELALSVPVFDLIMEPYTISQQNDETQKEILSYLKDKFPLLEEKIENSVAKDSSGSLINSKYYYPLIKEISYDTATEIKSKKLPGIYFEEKQKRKYPQNSLASHVVGFLYGENMSGIEKSYNDALTGYNGRNFKTIENSNTVFQSHQAQNGHSITTTIDQNIQLFAEKGVEKAMKDFPCETAAVIVMNPKTGEILAMASSNQFDLNAPSVPNKISQEEFDAMTLPQKSEHLNNMWKNFNISNTFEPGSIFKPMVIAAAIEENIISPSETFYCSGYKQVEDRKIHCIRRTGHGKETLEQVISNSCNSAMMEIAEAMGREIFYEYQKGFGFGEKTYIDLPNEESAETLLYPCEKLGPVELATSSFGQSFNCTAMQALTAFSVFANDGILMRPYVVSQISDANGNIVFENKPEVVRKVISPETCSVVNEYLLSVVDNGTGKKAKIEGYKIAGKSGTGEQGARSKEIYSISFVGFLPVSSPSVAAIVVIDKPIDYSDGVTTAAPIFRSIMLDIINYLKIEPCEETHTAPENATFVESFIEKDISEAEKILNQKNIKYKIIGNGKTVKNQFPKGGQTISLEAEVLIYTS